MNPLVLFDIDGTLYPAGWVDRHLAALRDGAELVLGNRPEVGGDWWCPGDTDGQIIARLLAAAGERPADLLLRRRCGDAAARAFRSAELAPLAPLPGVEALLETLTALRRERGCFTGNHPDIAAAKLEQIGISSRLLPRTGGFGEMADDRVSLALQLATSTAGRDVTLVADTPADVRAAAAVGWQSVAVATGHTSVEELAAHDPDLVVETLADPAVYALVAR